MEIFVMIRECIGHKSEKPENVRMRTFTPSKKAGREEEKLCFRKNE